MTKAQLIEDIAHRLGITTQAAKEHLETTLAAISDGVTLDDKVSIPGFGTFTATDVAARQVRHPSTGEPMYKPATRRVGFRAGNRLKEQVAGGIPVKAEGAR